MLFFTTSRMPGEENIIVDILSRLTSENKNEGDETIDSINLKCLNEDEVKFEKLKFLCRDNK